MERGNMEEKEDHKPYICKGYVETECLPLDQTTIIRAQKVGIGELLVKLSEDILVEIEQLGITENNYEDMAKIVKAIQDAISPILVRYHAPNIEIASFISPDTGVLNTVCISEYGITLKTTDQIEGIEVRSTDPSEIWRYIYPPSKIAENIVSTMIAVAEKHKSIRDDYVISFQKMRDLCLKAGTCRI
jgi:hypothetical protein